MNYHHLFCILGLSLLIACQKSGPITHPEDYNSYLQESGTDKLAKIDTEITFWQQRLENHPGSLIEEVKLGGLLSHRFAYSGDIRDIQQSDSLYLIANRTKGKPSSGLYRSLATNYVTQHRFREAWTMLDTAFMLGDDKYFTQLQRFDVAVELGNLDQAQYILNSLGNENRFECLIRQSKLEDKHGRLDQAIVLMEKALAKVKEDENQGLVLWAASNLGDMYSHANRYKDAYQAYLEVLKIDPQYYHTLRSIAWMAYSHDKNTEEAKRILHFLQKKHPVPDYDLLLAQIADYEGDETAKAEHLQKFYQSVSKPAYGAMYNKYVFDVLTVDWKEPAKALTLAEQEISNRATAESYALLSYAYLCTGESTKALELMKQHVENQCFEPEVLYRIGMIYKANGQPSEARHYLQTALESSFELGPTRARDVKAALQTM